MYKPTVTVAISALNEANNISNFLQSVLSQQEKGFILSKIIVISDGSKDQTVQIVQSFKSKKIELRAYKHRIGKSSRLNEIYTMLNSDILVQSDSDVIFSHPLVIHDIIQPLLSSKNVGMCGGRPMPTVGKNFVEKAINYSFEVYDSFRSSINSGNNTLSVDGRILAYKKELVKKIIVPTDMIANDAYTYFCCITLGYKYRYVSSAVVLFRSPQNSADQIKQNTRFLAAPIRMSRYFDKDLVAKESVIPTIPLIWRMFIQFIKHPIHCAYIIMINTYCRLMARSAEKKLTSRWPMADTTKFFGRKRK